MNGSNALKNPGRCAGVFYLGPCEIRFSASCGRFDSGPFSGIFRRSENHLENGEDFIGKPGIRAEKRISQGPFLLEIGRKGRFGAAHAPGEGRWCYGNGES